MSHVGAPAARVPLPGVDLGAERWALPAAAIHYLVGVRRLAPGARVVAFDGAGREATARLAEVEGLTVLLREGEVRAGRTGAPVVLVYALPKGDKLEDVLRQTTELGVAEIVLFQAERSVSRLPGDRADRKRERWAKIVDEAARQCGRADVPRVTGPLPDLAAALATTAAVPTRLLLHPEGDSGLADAPIGAECAIFVGPEGGFSPAEVAMAHAAGVVPVRLASPVLRTETAAVVGTALALHRLGAL